MTSVELLSRFTSANDFNALMELYNRHHDTLVKWIRSRYGVDKSIAENVAVETFERIRDGQEYDGESFDDWLCTLAGNCAAAVKARIERQRRRAAMSESCLESLPIIEQQALTVLFNWPQDIAANALDLTIDELGEITDNALASLDCDYQLVAA